MTATRALVLALSLGAPGVTLAQSVEGEPLSAIDWLSQPIVLPDPAPGGAEPAILDEPPPVSSAVPPPVTVTALGRPTPDAIGLLPPEVTGLPRDLWAGSDADILATLVRAQRVPSVPALRELLATLLLAEATPPAGADTEAPLFLARIDGLLVLGQVEAAGELLAAAEDPSPAVFARTFDVALLLGREGRACDLLRDRPDVAPTLAARIFCLARTGDWAAAALTLNTAVALGDVAEDEAELLTRFLDPELFDDDMGPATDRRRMTPLTYRMREAIGEGVTSADLPLAFAHSDLRETAGLKARLEAAERLARHGAIDPNLLFGLYTDRRPAASGGVWDRAEAIQRLDRALADEDAEAVARALPSAWRAMEAARLQIPFAQFYGPRLATLPLDGRAADLAERIALLSPDYEGVARARSADGDTDLLFARAVAMGDVAGVTPTTDREQAIHAAFTGAPAPEVLLDLAAQGRLGEALLRAIALGSEGARGDLGDLTDALALLRAVGLEDTARRTALQVLLLDTR